MWLDESLHGSKPQLRKLMEGLCIDDHALDLKCNNFPLTWSILHKWSFHINDHKSKILFII